MIRRIIEYIVRKIWIFGYLISKKRSYSLFKKFYNNNDILINQEEQCIIYMADGKRIHGGLSDRLWGIVSLFNYCSENDIQFKINFVFPFQLNDFLIPNKYDWTLKQSSDIVYNKKVAEPVFILNVMDDPQKKITNYCLKSSKKQIHVYTTMRYKKELFYESFHTLFKPVPLLQEHISEHLQQIGNNYVSITFRFQQLLGDFKERNFPVLSEKKQEDFMERCLSVIPSIKKTIPESQRILITSDSGRFLEKAIMYDYVYIVPGERSHPDYSSNTNNEEYLKSFIDMFLISNAQKIYFVHSTITYKSKFAETSAFIGNKPYEVIKID